MTIETHPEPAAKPVFAERKTCIGCGSSDLEVLACGTFSDDPLYTFISEDPWGESPLPHIKDERWEFARCRQCTQKFHTHILSPRWQERLFTVWMSDAAIRKFEEIHGVNKPSAVFESGRSKVRHVLRLEKMTRPLREEEALKVMDFGCGWGEFLAIAAFLGAEAYGVDRDQDRRRQAEAIGVTVVTSLDELDPALKGQFHAITLFQVLEHLEEPLPLLEALSEWIMPGGILILETPNCEGVEGFNNAEDYRAINPLSHINGFTPSTLKSIAQRAGFTPVLATPAHATADPLAVARTEIRRVVGSLLKPTTDRYFRRS